MFKAYFCILVFIISLLFVAYCDVPRDVISEYDRTNVERAVWVEFDPIIVSKAATLDIQGGEYSLNNQPWCKNKQTVNTSDTLQIRVKSSSLPEDVTMCRVILNEDTVDYKIKNANFEIESQTKGLRNINLGISGADMDSIGGPGKHWARYNLNENSQRGLAVREGLIPDIKPLFNARVRDPVICIGGDGRYYLTGSTGDDIWHFNDGVELWVSEDLEKWEYMGLVWTFEKDATWEKAWRFHKKATRALWAPELHYVKGNYYITHSMPPGDRGLLKSATGKPEGPYVNEIGRASCRERVPSPV